jgi:thiol:disulfide interchange protein
MVEIIFLGDIAGTVGGVVFGICLAPAIAPLIIKNKSTYDVSYSWLALYSLGLGLNFFYLIIQKAVVGNEPRSSWILLLSFS